MGRVENDRWRGRTFPFSSIGGSRLAAVLRGTIAVRVFHALPLRDFHGNTVSAVALLPTGAVCDTMYRNELEITMGTTTMVHVRVNEKIKAQATKALTAMGLSVSDAVRVFLTRVATEKRLPFELKVPNADTRAAMAEVDEMLSTRRARFATAEDLFDDLAKNRK